MNRNCDSSGIGIGSSLEETTDSPDFEGHAGEAKEVSVREEGDGKKPHILLKRQSKDETTGKYPVALWTEWTTGIGSGTGCPF